jgi:hypothetical protein
MPAAKPMVLAPPTNAELQLKEEAENAKTKLIEEIQQFKLTDLDDNEEEIDPRVAKFNVSNPVKIVQNKLQSNMVYTVNGEDDEGEFETTRRYKEFNALSNVLRTRWVGCYVPSIPEKNLNITKNNEDNFVEERRSLLERFLKECAKYDYIIFSKEFKKFARHDGEVDRVLLSMEKQTPLQVLEKYRLNFQIDEEQDPKAITEYKTTIMAF